MISQHLTQGLAHLRQPRLLQPICPNMLSDGLPQPGLLEGLDAIFCEDAVGQIMGWDMPPDLPVGTRREDRWRTVSSLQKAIRRGDVRAAMVAAHAAHGMDPRYLLRRLAVCAVEDVGLGNLYAVAATLALVGDKASRHLAGEQKTAVWLAAQLAGGWKDRTACNLCVVVDFDRRLHPTMNEWEHLPDDNLAAKASNTALPIKERMLAAWLLAGTKRFWNVNVPTDNDRPRWALMRLMILSGMPLILYWLADRAATRGGDCMFVSFLPIWQMLEGAGNEDIKLRRSDFLPDPGIGPLLACGYDMHTREGQAALRRFALDAYVSSSLAAISVAENRLPALFSAVFVVEGGRLALRVSLPELDWLHFEAIRLELEYFGVSTPKDRRRLLGAISDKLDMLHRFRLEALGQRPGRSGGRGARAPSRLPPTSYPTPQPLALQSGHKQTTTASPAILPDPAPHDEMDEEEKVERGRGHEAREPAPHVDG